MTRRHAAAQRLGAAIGRAEVRMDPRERRRAKRVARDRVDAQRRQDPKKQGR